MRSVTRLSLHGTHAALLVAAVWTAPLVAQERPTLQAGVAVRLWFPERDVPVAGALFTWSRDSVWMFVDSVQANAFALEDVALFEVHRGKHPALTVGSNLLGGVLGAILGPAILTDEDRCQTNVVDDPDCSHLTSDVLIGAAVGAVALGVVGRRIAVERWQEIPIDRLRLGVRRDGYGGWMVGARVVLRW